jgi:tetratricopeptide (TPR) repeat protein
MCPVKGKPLLLFVFGIVFAGSFLTLRASVVTPSGVTTDPLNLDPQVRKAYQQFYMLDYDGALSGFEKVQAAHPSEPIATDYVLDAVLFRELYRLDLLDTTFYVHDGFLTGKHSATKADPAIRSRLNSLIQKAIEQSDVRLKANPKDVDALFARGWARSLDAVFTGMVDRSFVSALRKALEARSDNEKVLELSPTYVDAKLVVGVHQYVIGSLPLAFKIFAGLAGITGSKSKGINDLRDAGAHGIITSVEARTALGLFLRREAKYDDAIVVLRTLRDDYPRDFLFCLEVANLTKDAGDGPTAITEYRNLVDQAKKPGYFPSAHIELAWFGLAETLRGQRDYTEAATAYEQAANQPTASRSLRARCELNAGEMYDLLNERDRAEKEYQVVLEQDADSVQTDFARKYLKSPFNGH